MPNRKPSGTVGGVPAKDVITLLTQVVLDMGHRRRVSRADLEERFADLGHPEAAHSLAWALLRSPGVVRHGAGASAKYHLPAGVLREIRNRNWRFPLTRLSLKDAEVLAALLDANKDTLTGGLSAYRKRLKRALGDLRLQEAKWKAERKA